MSLLNQDLSISSLLKTYFQITDIPLLHKIIKYLLSIISKYENQSNGLTLSDLTKPPYPTNDHSSYTTLAINDFVDKDIEDYITNIKSSTITHKSKKRKIYYSRSQTPLMKRNNSFTLQMRENSKRLREMNSTVQSKVKNYIEKGNLVSSYRSKEISSNTNNIKLYVRKKVNGTLRKDSSSNNLNKNLTHSVSMSLVKTNNMSKSSSTVSMKRSRIAQVKSHSKSTNKKKEIVNNGRIVLRDNRTNKNKGRSNIKVEKKMRKDFSS